MHEAAEFIIVAQVVQEETFVNWARYKQNRRKNNFLSSKKSFTLINQHYFTVLPTFFKTTNSSKSVSWIIAHVHKTKGELHELLLQLHRNTVIKISSRLQYIYNLKRIMIYNLLIQISYDNISMNPRHSNFSFLNKYKAIWIVNKHIRYIIWSKSRSNNFSHDCK